MSLSADRVTEHATAEDAVAAVIRSGWPASSAPAPHRRCHGQIRRVAAPPAAAVPGDRSRAGDPLVNRRGRGRRRCDRRLGVLPARLRGRQLPRRIRHDRPPVPGHDRRPDVRRVHGPARRRPPRCHRARSGAVVTKQPASAQPCSSPSSPAPRMGRSVPSSSPGPRWPWSAPMNCSCSSSVASAPRHTTRPTARQARPRLPRLLTGPRTRCWPVWPSRPRGPRCSRCGTRR